LASILAGLVYWICVDPVASGITAGPLVVLIPAMTILDGRRVERLRSERHDTICDFRKSFDVRQVDPWVVRATHEAFGNWFDPKRPKFPLRASDSIEHDMKMDWEDLDDLAQEVAQRAGYILSNCEANPLYGKIRTVEDFVLFFTHQPKTVIR